MKNNSILLVLLISITSHHYLFAEIIEEKWPSGKLSKKYNKSIENKKTGAYSEFFENGQIKIKAFYLNDLLDGFYYEFLEDGKKKIEAQYTKGKKNGFFKTYENGALAKEENWVDGILAFPRSIAEITSTLAAIPKLKTEFVGEWPKDFKIERFTKTVESDNISGLAKLREYRYLCGLPYEDIQINKPYISYNLDALIILNKHKYLSHTPTNPGLPEDVYQSGFKGTSSSNLSWGNFGMSTPLSLEIYMDDSDKMNMDHVGHRRWCLNPAMKMTGFALDNGFSAMWSLNVERKNIPAFEYICFPASGYMPNTHFKNTDVWSVTLNPTLFKMPEKASLNIQVSSIKNSIKSDLKITYQNLDFQMIGLNNCIIFKPDNISVLPKSRYLVQITGLKDKSNKDKTIEYFVEFF